MKRFAGWMLSVLLLLCAAFPSFAQSEGWEVQDMKMEGASMSFVRCPVFSGNVLAPQVNALIQQEGRVQEYITLLSGIGEGSTGLNMDYALTPADASGPIVSLVFSAQGKMLTGRPSQVYYPMVIDLEAGEKVGAEAVFTDLGEAEALVALYLEEQIAPLLSTHLENSDLLPVPMERFALTEGGVTFYYEGKQLSFLSGYAGAVHVPYTVLGSVLNLEEGSVLSRMSMAKKMLAVHDETADMIRHAASDGRLGPLPAVAGMALEDAVSLYRCTTDGMYYPGGAYYELEDASMQGALVITDEAETQVTAVFSKDISLFGLATGTATREEWQSLLGEPVFSLEMGASEAEPYLLCPGVSDYYAFDGYELMLHADENGVLYAAKISQ